MKLIREILKKQKHCNSLLYRIGYFNITFLLPLSRYFFRKEYRQKTNIPPARKRHGTRGKIAEHFLFRHHVFLLPFHFLIPSIHNLRGSIQPCNRLPSPSPFSMLLFHFSQVALSGATSLNSTANFSPVSSANFSSVVPVFLFSTVLILAPVGRFS